MQIHIYPHIGDFGHMWQKDIGYMWPKDIGYMWPKDIGYMWQKDIGYMWPKDIGYMFKYIYILTYVAYVRMNISYRHI